MQIKDLMKSPVVTVDENASVREARALMAEHRIRRLPVMHEGRLTGMLTDRDCRKAWTSSATALKRFELTYLLDELKVKEVMSRTVFTVTPETSVLDTARLIRDRKIGGVPVVGDDRVVGMVTTTELLRALADELDARYPTFVQEILVPTDFSDASARAVQHAEALAHRYGAKLNILYVVPRSSLSQMEVPLSEVTMEQLRESQEREALTRLAASFPDGGQTSYEVTTGYPEQEIARMARAVDADLIVMAAHKRTRFGQLLSGSVTEAVLRQAPCPVLVLHE